MILCGWCRGRTAPGERCAACGHADPARPWAQRGEDPPEAPGPQPGRPRIDAAELRRRLASGGTDEDIAERFDVDERTVRRWRKASG